MTVEGVSVSTWGLLLLVLAMALAFLLSLRTHADPRRGPRASLGNALLSADPLQRARIWRFLFGASNHAFGILALNYGAHRGVLDAPSAHQLTAVAALAIGGMYLVLRTGWNRRFADPALTEAQMWVGIVLLGWGYLIGGPGRPVALILLFVILMFALLTVTFRQMTRASALAVLVFGAASMGVVGREGALPLTVDLQVLYFCVLLIILSCACVLVRQLSLLRERAAHARHDLAEAMAKLHGQVIRDELTGLFNRRHMHKLLRIEQARADRSGFPWCVAMIDLDLFKRVNDEHGHPVGDEVLRSTAQVLSGGLRGADQVARWGGEEFLVMFPDTDSDDACQVLERIGQTLSRTQVSPTVPGLRVTFSAGVTRHLADEPLARTIDRADHALYRAKASGRNRTECLSGPD